MSLPELSVRKRVTFLMVFIAITGTGIFGFTQLGVDLYPDMNFPIILVTSSMQGAGPEEMENLVTDLLEQAVSRVSNVTKVSSQSVAGLSIVTAEFGWGHSLEQAETDVRRQLEWFSDFLPEDASDPLIFPLDPSMQPVMFIGFSSELLNEYELRILVEEEIEPLINRVEGVGSAITQGGLVRQINVELDPALLERTGISASQVVGALGSVRNNTPAGTLESGGMNMSIRVESAFHDLAEVEQLVVGWGQGGPVLLRDIATVTDGEADVLQLVRFNGRPSITTYANKRSDANTVNVCRGIREVLGEIDRDYGQLLTPVILFDQSEFIEESISNLGSTAVQAFVLAFLVLLFFLRSAKGSSIVGISIPISVIVTFAVMHFVGVQLNMISLAGLALAIGMLVDNAIVVQESIFRHREAGESPRDSAINGAREVSTAISASTLTTLAVFVPILFVPGIAGELFKEMVLTISFSLLVSLFVALSLVPLITSWIRKLIPDRKPGSLGTRIGDRIESMERNYGRAVRWALTHKKLVLLPTLGAFILSFIVMGMLPSDFFPESDDGFLAVDFTLPVGTDLATTDSVVRILEDSLAAIIPESDRLAIYSASGSGEGVMAIFGTSGSHAASLMVRLTPSSQRSVSMFEYQDRFREVLDRIPGLEYSSEAGMALLSGAAIEIRVFGDDLDSLYAKAEEVKVAVAGIDGVADVTTSMQDLIPEYSFIPDPVRLSLLGASRAQVAAEIRTAFMGSTASVLRDGEDEIDIVVRYPESVRDSREDIEYATVMGLPAISYGTLTQRVVSNTISRQDQARVVTISCDVSGRSLGAVAADVGATMRSLDMNGYRFELGGEMEDQKETFMYLGIAIAVAAALVYMVMAGQFESFMEPFIIIFTLPLAFIGVILGLAVTGTPVSVMALIGMLMLAGIVVNNGIVMIDYANQLRCKGMEVGEAIVQASTIRMRPILMTALTTILAMVPLALEIGEGAESWAPMAVTVIGGMVVATLLTLVVEPCIYVIFGKRKKYCTDGNL
jgi:HAE1 family hydrophobic/amphiphilic exporter-1